MYFLDKDSRKILLCKTICSHSIIKNVLLCLLFTVYFVSVYFSIVYFISVYFSIYSVNLVSRFLKLGCILHPLRVTEIKQDQISAATSAWRS